MKVLILNSTGYSRLGWATGPASQKTLADLLAAAGLDGAIAEVETTADLDELLDGLDDDTLVWPNAYHVRVRAGSDETAWLADALEARGVPFVGSPAPALRAMLHKDECQARLAAAGIPIPRFTVVTERDPGVVRAAFETADLSWPVVVKPTSTAGSHGVSRVFGLEDLAAQVGQIFDRHGPRAIIEEYLPSADLTVGVLTPGTSPQWNAQGSGTVLLPTWYEIEDREPGILDLETRLIPWGGLKRMRVVAEPRVLEQVETIIPRVVSELGIRDVTRIDGRIDDHGVLRIFDVNGMPGMEYPESVMLHQAMAIWGETDGLPTLGRLVCTVAASAAERYGLEAPNALAAHASPDRLWASTRQLELVADSVAALP